VLLPPGLAVPPCPPWRGVRAQPASSPFWWSLGTGPVGDGRRWPRPTVTPP